VEYKEFLKFFIKIKYVVIMDLLHHLLLQINKLNFLILLLI